jgi:hypothetical protein
MNYEHKYKKYKQKYFELKNNLYAGGTELDKLNNLDDKYSNGVDQIIDFQKKMNKFYAGPMTSLLDHILKKIDITNLESELKTDVPQDNRFIKFINKLFEKVTGTEIFTPFEYISLFNQPYNNILTLIFNKSKYKDCEVTDFMEFNKVRIMDCPNKKLVRGSCSDPGFFDESSIDEFEDINMLNLFESVNEYMKDKLQLKIVVGATQDSEMKEYVSNGLILYITPADGFINISKAIEKLKKNEIINNSLKIKDSFPLGTSKPLTIKILNIIININKSGKSVTLINKMCGSCFRSFYYLKKNGITYEVNPAQGLNNDDTIGIQTCFAYQR